MNFNKNLNEADTEKVLKHMERANIYLKSSFENRNQAVSIMMDCASILSIDEIKWLLQEMENDIICPNNLSNNHDDPECTISNSKVDTIADTYDFLQEHREIQPEAYTSKQLEEMAEIDKKFKQLEQYQIGKTINKEYYIDFQNVETKLDDCDIMLRGIGVFASNIYSCYVETFNKLKGLIILVGKYGNRKKFKWDGENFKEISTAKYPAIDVSKYDFLKQHKEIKPEDYTAEQLDKMAEIDKKFRQLGEYSIHPFKSKFVIFLNNITMSESVGSPYFYKPWYPSENIYDVYIGTFNQLKNAGIIFKHLDNCKGLAFEWDGKNFVPYEENKINIDEAEKIVQEDMKKKCEKSYKESIEKHVVSGSGYKADIKIKSDKSPEDLAKEVEQIIFKNSGIDFTNLYHEIEKAVKQEIENYNKDMALSTTMGDSFLKDIINEKSSNFRKQLKEIISNKLDDYGKILTYKISLPALGCSNMEEVKSRVENLNNFKKQLNQNVFYKIPEKEFIELYNKAFNSDAENIFDIVVCQDIKL